MINTKLIKQIGLGIDNNNKRIFRCCKLPSTMTITMAKCGCTYVF